MLINFSQLSLTQGPGQGAMQMWGWGVLFKVKTYYPNNSLVTRIN